MIISSLKFNKVNDSEYVVTVNKLRVKLVSSKVANAIFELTKMKVLKLINSDLYARSVRDILEL